MTFSISLADVVRVALGIAIGYKLKAQIGAGINAIKKGISSLVTVKA